MKTVTSHVFTAAALAAAIAAAALSLRAPAAAPPVTTPAGPRSVVTGTLTAATTLDLQKPDLSRAVVYIAANDALDHEAPPKDPAIVTQHDKKFIPDFLVVSRNTTIEFPNDDPFDHNVFSRSKAAPAFDLDRYPKGMSKSRVFSETGVVQVFCNIHPSMRAMIVVTPNRCFARADARGGFSIPDVPPGKYTLVAWQDRCDEVRQEIEVTAGGASGITLQLKESRQGIMAAEGPAARQTYGLDRGLGVKQEKLNLPVVKDAHPAPVAAPCCDTK